MPDAENATEKSGEKSDEERGARVLRDALLRVESACVPFEILMLITMLHGLDGGPRIRPDDAVVAAYLIGKSQDNAQA